MKITKPLRRLCRQERGSLRGEDVAERENAARSLFLAQDPLLLSGVSLVHFFPLMERNEHKNEHIISNLQSKKG